MTRGTEAALLVDHRILGQSWEIQTVPALLSKGQEGLPCREELAQSTAGTPCPPCQLLIPIFQRESHIFTAPGVIQFPAGMVWAGKRHKQGMGGGWEWEQPWGYTQILNRLFNMQLITYLLPYYIYYLTQLTC